MNLRITVGEIRKVIELRRIASAYVIDHRGLNEDEVREALTKTGPQYSNLENVSAALQSVIFNDDQDVRTIGPAILTEILLNQDDFVCSQRETEDRLIEWEQEIIDRSNDDLANKRGQKIKNITLFSFVLEAAWENGNVSTDEAMIIEKVRRRLKVSESEYRIIEAKLGFFPKPRNSLHTRGEIESVRRTLQSKGLLFAIRDDKDEDFDIIPDEVAKAIRKASDIEIRRHGYQELLTHRFVRSKDYLTALIEKAELIIDGRPTLQELQEICIQSLNPSQILGGFAPNDGLPLEKLRDWCAERNLKVSGTKAELIERIIECYDQLLQKSPNQEDERELYYNFYSQLAHRDLAFLRAQFMIEKDLECERRFEEATSFLFEKRLGHKPLPNVGSERADGALSYGDRLILWDNKSKEQVCSLQAHIRQFDRYIKASEKPIAAFLVIAPQFTNDSEALAIKYQVENQVPIALIEADELKWLADEWAKVSATKKIDSFDLGYLAQPGKLKREILASLILS